MKIECKHCSNGGTCTILGDQTIDFKCSCPIGFRGRYCEQDIDECESRLFHGCPTGSICTNHFGGYTCKCPIGEIMLRSACVRKLTCRDNLCRNNALCYNVDGLHQNYICQCDLGFKGIDCELEVRECSNPLNICGNDGVCVATTQGFRCDCLPGFSGKFCQTTVQSEHAPKLAKDRAPFSTSAYGLPNSSIVRVSDDLYYILVIGVGLFIAILIIGCFLLYLILLLKRFRIYERYRCSSTRTYIFLEAMKDSCLCRSYGRQDNNSSEGKSESATLRSKPTAGTIKLLKERIEQAERRAKQEIQAFSMQLSKTALTSPAAQKSLQDMQQLLIEV